jgi:hypothetical protein
VNAARAAPRTAIPAAAIVAQITNALARLANQKLLSDIFKMLIVLMMIGIRAPWLPHIRVFRTSVQVCRVLVMTLRVASVWILAL